MFLLFVEQLILAVFNGVAGAAAGYPLEKTHYESQHSKYSILITQKQAVLQGIPLLSNLSFIKQLTDLISRVFDSSKRELFPNVHPLYARERVCLQGVCFFIYYKLSPPCLSRWCRRGVNDAGGASKMHSI